MDKKSYNILLICNLPPIGGDANTIRDHIESFSAFSKHKIWVYSNLGKISPQLDLNKFDVIIIHYSICLLNDYYLSSEAKEQIRSFNGLKIVFVQDEYRKINTLIAQLNYVKADVLFTCFPETEIEKIYPREALPQLSKYNTLTGYVPSALCKSDYHQQMSKRMTHVGYRARKLPFWYGELAYEKWNIVDQWKKHVNHNDIHADLSYNENKRLYGKRWITFIGSCKTTLGVESGASVMDFTGELENRINIHQMLYPRDSFFEVQAQYLLPYEGRYRLNQISPRCFEAIALKTVLILYEGEYSGILKPDRHYIVLKKDFSNISDVLEKITNDEYLQNMANTAYDEIALNQAYSYQSFVEEVDKIINKEFVVKNKVSCVSFYQEDEFQKIIKKIPYNSRLKKQAMNIFKTLPLSLQMIIRVCVKPKKVYGFKILRYLPRTMKDKFKI